MSVLIDSYSEVNSDCYYLNYTGVQEEVGQSFAVVKSAVLSECRVWLLKNGSPTGNCSVKVYAHTGTYGTDGKPTGSVLATSSTLDVSTLIDGTTLYEYTFTFSGANKITLAADTKYCLEVAYGQGDVDNLIGIGADWSTSTYAGNISWTNDGTNWITSSSNDICFYIYGERGPAVGDKAPLPTFVNGFNG